MVIIEKIIEKITDLYNIEFFGNIKEEIILLRIQGI
jgi:hypothetical protein